MGHYDSCYEAEAELKRNPDKYKYIDQGYKRGVNDAMDILYEFMVAKTIRENTWNMEPETIIIVKRIVKNRLKAMENLLAPKPNKYPFL